MFYTTAVNAAGQELPGQHPLLERRVEARVEERTAALRQALAVVEAQKHALEAALRMRDETQRQREAELEDARLLHGISAMLIDENTIGDLYQRLVDAATLEQLGHATSVVLEAPKAVAAALAFAPNQVFLDPGMPHLNGFDLARALRAQPALDAVSLAALSGWGRDEDRARSRQAGIDHHLTKPVTLEQVPALLSRLPA